MGLGARDAMEHHLPAGQATFIGRRQELRSLEQQLAAALAGTARIVLVAGEPGIGKTRIADEVATLAVERGVRVLWGRCHEGAGAPAFWPWVQIFRAYLRDGDTEAIRQQMGAGAVEIAQIVPEIRDRLPDLPAPAPLEPEQARFRLFDAIGGFLQRAGESLPLVLILDDLHWADAPSLLLLRFLATQARDARLMVLGTYRDVELDEGHHLTRVLLTLARERQPEPMILHGLDATDLAGVIRITTGSELDSAVLSAVHRQTEGNPFFATEIVRLLVTDGSLDQPHWPGAGRLTIPPTVRETVNRRLERLSPPCLDLLGVAAVVGREFDLSLIGNVSGLPRSDVFGIVEEAAAARIVAGLATPLGRYRFTHALVRETLYDRLSSSRRILLHQQVAEALEEIWAGHPEPPLAELAHHFAEAAPSGDPERAIRYAVRAAERSAELLAFEEALQHYEAALAALRLGQQVDGTRECDLLLALGDTLLTTGEPRRVVDDVAPAALARAEALSDHARASRACQLAIEGLFRYGVVTAAATPEWRRWAERADRYATPDTADRVRADVALAFHHFNGLSDIAWELSVRALALARRLDDPETLASAAFAIVNWPWRTRPQWDERLRVSAEFAERSDAGVSARTRGRLLFRSGMAFLSAGDRDRAEVAWREGEALIPQTRDPLLRLYTVIGETVRLVMGGELEAALEASGQLIALAEEFGSPMFGRQYGLFLRQRPLMLLGRAEEGRAEIIELREVGGNSGPWWWDALQALYEGHAGRLDEAGRGVRRIVAERAGSHGEGLLGAHLATQILEAALLAEQPEAVRSLADWLAPVAGLLMIDYGMTSVARHLGAAAALLGDGMGAVARSEQALALAKRARFRPEAALCRLQLAENLMSHEPKEWQRAQAYIDDVVPELRDMKMQPALDRALRLLERRGAAGHGRDVVRPGGLTEREVEVLRMLATGHTNQEIAEALVLSVRTVENHIAHIYAKVGARSRAEATTYAFRQGLV